jgi:hypothetical protein
MRNRLTRNKWIMTDVQITISGQMPQETRRTRSMDYTAMNLRGLMELAELPHAVDVDLWNAKTEDGRCIRAALDYLVRHLDGQKPWPHEQVAPFDLDRLIPILHLASRQWASAGYRQTLRNHVSEEKLRAHRVNLLHPAFGADRQGSERR